MLEKTLTDFGSLDDNDVEMSDVGLRPGSKGVADVLNDDSSVGSTVKSEEREHRATSHEQQKGESGPWNAINTVSGAPTSRRESVQTPSTSQFRTYDSYSNPGSLPPPNPPPNAQPSQYSHFGQSLNTFRPPYSSETPGPGVSPSLTSPASYSVSNSLSTPSQASPPFERQSSGGYGNGWTPQNTSYPMASHAPYMNGSGHHTPQSQQALSQLPPLQPAAAYPTPNPPQLPSMQQQQLAPPLPHFQPQQQQPIQAAPQLPEPQMPGWDHYQKEQWLDSLHTRMSADDLAAFVDGGDLSDWASRNDYNQAGWLNALWSGPTG